MLAERFIMTKLARVFLLAFTLLSLVACGLVSAESSDAISYSEGKRLDQKLKVKGTGIPLSDLLAELTAKIGVKLSAKKDAADDKIFVAVKDIQLAQYFLVPPSIAVSRYIEPRSDG